MMHALLRFCTASQAHSGSSPPSRCSCGRRKRAGRTPGSACGWHEPRGPERPDLVGSSQEQGLSAGYAVFLVRGRSLLTGRCGSGSAECPDEVSLISLVGSPTDCVVPVEMDNYLANYTASLPNEAHRTGSFKPYRSLMERFFASEHHGATEKDILFPHGADMKNAFPSPYTHGNLPITMHNASADTKATKGIELTSVPPSGTELLQEEALEEVPGVEVRGRDRPAGA